MAKDLQQNPSVNAQQLTAIQSLQQNAARFLREHPWVTLGAGLLVFALLVVMVSSLFYAAPVAALALRRPDHDHNEQDALSNVDHQAIALPSELPVEAPVEDTLSIVFESDAADTVSPAQQAGRDTADRPAPDEVDVLADDGGTCHDIHEQLDTYMDGWQITSVNCGQPSNTGGQNTAFLCSIPLTNSTPPEEVLCEVPYIAVVPDGDNPCGVYVKRFTPDQFDTIKDDPNAFSTLDKCTQEAYYAIQACKNGIAINATSMPQSISQPRATFVPLCTGTLAPSSHGLGFDLYGKGYAVFDPLRREPAMIKQLQAIVAAQDTPEPIVIAMGDNDCESAEMTECLEKELPIAIPTGLMPEITLPTPCGAMSFFASKTGCPTRAVSASGRYRSIGAQACDATNNGQHVGVFNKDFVVIPESQAPRVSRP